MGGVRLLLLSFKLISGRDKIIFFPSSAFENSLLGKMVEASGYQLMFSRNHSAVEYSSPRVLLKVIPVGKERGWLGIPRKSKLESVLHQTGTSSAAMPNISEISNFLSQQPSELDPRPRNSSPISRFCGRRAFTDVFVYSGFGFPIISNPHLTRFTPKLLTSSETFDIQPLATQKAPEKSLIKWN